MFDLSWAVFGLCYSCQKLGDDFAGHIGQAEVSPLKTVSQARVIEAEEMQDRGVKIIHMDRVLRDAETEIIRRADDLPAFDPAAPHPDAIGVRMMVATAPA